MSVTVADILKYPCLKDAKVVAGKGGLNKILSSVSVLEFADPNALQKELFNNNEFYGSEIVITAFANIPHNIEQQCANVRRLAEAGEVGLILYYVGIFMPSVSEELIQLANALDFVLIVMPEKRMDLRYSEVICEVMEGIFRDQASGSTLVSDVLAQMSRLPAHQRTVDGVLRTVRDRIRCTLILADHNRRTLGMAAWPMSLEIELEDLPQTSPMTPVLLSKNRTLWRCPLDDLDGLPMELYLIKDGSPMPKDLVLQAVDVVRLAVNLWSSHHADVQISELVRAILRDEPMKMRRLAELFHIDVESMHVMWVLQCDDQKGIALSCIRDTLSARCKTMVADDYEGYVVAFMDWPQQGEQASQIADSLIAQLDAAGLDATLTRCHHLSNTAEARKAFLQNQKHLSDAKKIWPECRSFTLTELEYAARCRRIIDAGEETLQNAMRPLMPLDGSKEDAELRKTLEIYLLDAGSSVANTADRMFLHKNTVKYRIGRICGLLECSINKEPEKFYLHQASAIWRLMKNG